jgi:hypothetical protein
LISSKSFSGRPSTYLQELRTIASKVGVGDELVRHKFLQFLPSPISAALGAQSDLDMTQLGSIANNLMPFAQKKCSAITNINVAKRRSNTSRKCTPSTSASLLESTEVPMPAHAFRVGQHTRVCRAHIYYGELAKTCKPWCKWPNKQNLKIHPSSRPSSCASSPVRSPPLTSTSGKLERRADGCAAIGPPLLAWVAYVGTIKISFLVDTGASVSIIPERFLTGVVMYPTAVRLQTATGKPIKISGEVCL